MRSNALRLVVRLEDAMHHLFIVVVILRYNYTLARAGNIVLAHRHLLD